MTGRQRDVLPLPLLVEEAVPKERSLSRACLRRIHRRAHVQREANLVIKSLNPLYTNGKLTDSSSRVSDLGVLPEVQRLAITHVLKRVKEFGPPPLHVSTAGALEALRIAYSPYGGDSVGVGDVVPMNLDQLSIPGMEGDGVDIANKLEGGTGEYLKNPRGLMLQDADNWGAVADEVRQIRIYDDPQLRRPGFYKGFLKKLKQAGILTFSRAASGRVGAFVVRKKPKEVDGVMRERQRLILDCRRVNALFRAPPVTELGSLPAVGDMICTSRRATLFMLQVGTSRIASMLVGYPIISPVTSVFRLMSPSPRPPRSMVVIYRRSSETCLLTPSLAHA